jgi:hypothetical protein
MLCAFSAAIAWGQTAVDLRTQSKNVDFSGAPSTKPFQTGTAIPPICSTGQMFFLTTAPAGSNVYGCEATNIWALQGGGSGGTGGGASAVNQLTDAICVRSIATRVTCSFPAGGTNFGNSNYSTSFSTNWTVTISSGAATATTFYQYWNPNSPGTISIDTTGSSFSGIVCNAGCTLVRTGVTGYPVDVKPISRLTAGAAASTWDSFTSCLPTNGSGCIDDRALLSLSVTKAGTNLTSSVDAHGIKTISADPTSLLAWTGPATFTTLGSATNCASAGSPAGCGSSMSGSVTIAAGATTIVVASTAVTANSQIFVIQDDSLGSRLGVTCYTAANTTPRITARNAGTNFTITATAPAGNPGCYSYLIVN